jgi:hypothetical protein
MPIIAHSTQRRVAHDDCMSIQTVVGDEVQTVRSGSHPEATRRDQAKNVQQLLCLLLLVVKASAALGACRDQP